jgi:hypothetical protein
MRTVCTQRRNFIQQAREPGIDAISTLLTDRIRAGSWIRGLAWKVAALRVDVRALCRRRALELGLKRRKESVTL